jgi:transcriptional regulator with XRE-family HTH domain
MSKEPAELEARRRDLGSFLRSRRARLSPADAGLPAGFRRRTPGLRREEVALLAGVGVTWYTWLEQGRDIRPSAEALSAIADALHLTRSERRHLYLLNGRPAPELRASGAERVEEPLLRMLASLSGQPAYVLGRRWDILAWNDAASAVFGDYGRLVDDERNVMHLVFADEAHRKLLIDWEKIAPISLAMFRADSARYAGDPDFERLIAILQRSSLEFRQWWRDHEVLLPFTGHKRVQHPQAGHLTFEYTTLLVTDQPDMKLVVYTPLDADDTTSRLQLLLRGLRPSTRKSPPSETRHM